MQPALCDLTGDRIACAILHALGKQPWKQEHWNALIDRLHDLGYHQIAEEKIRQNPYVVVTWQRTLRHSSRRTIKRLLRELQWILTTKYGDYSTTLEEALDTD